MYVADISTSWGLNSSSINNMELWTLGEAFQLDWAPTPFEKKKQKQKSKSMRPKFLAKLNSQDRKLLLCGKHQVGNGVNCYFAPYKVRYQIMLIR